MSRPFRLLDLALVRAALVSVLLLIDDDRRGIAVVAAFAPPRPTAAPRGVTLTENGAFTTRRSRCRNAFSSASTRKNLRRLSARGSGGASGNAAVAATLRSTREKRAARETESTTTTGSSRDWVAGEMNRIGETDDGVQQQIITTTGGIFTQTADDFEQQHEESWAANKMTVIPPSKDDNEDKEALELIRHLDARLRRPDVRRRFDEMIRKGETSVRRIQAGRYEVFVDAVDGGYGSAAFDWVASQISDDLWRSGKDDDDNHRRGCMGGSPGAIKSALIEYARRRAMSIESHRGENYRHHNFSLLVSYGKCPRQHPHIDLLEPNAQFGLIITDESPGTIWYETDHAIRDARDLQRAWAGGETGGRADADAEDWVAAMEDDGKVRHLLRNFGDVLSPVLKAREPEGGAPLKAGTLLSLPGGVVHAGPACDDFRAVLFFTAYSQRLHQRPPAAGSDGAAGVVVPYHVDTQYFASILLSDIISQLWQRLSVGNRRYLLERLAEYLLRAPSDNRGTHRHLPVGSSMYEFAGAIETGMLSPPNDDGGAEGKDGGGGRNKFSRFLDWFASQERLRL